MRILICNWKDRRHPAAGGAEVYTHECAKRWAGAGHEVTLFCAAVEGEPEVDERPGYRIVRRGSRIGVYAAAKKFIRTNRDSFDVIVDEINTRPFFAHRYSKGTPVVALAHQVAREVWFHETPWPLAVVGRYVLEPMWLRAYAGVPTLTVSNSSAESLRGYGLRNLSVVLEGVEIPATVALPVPKSDVPTLAFCGRMVSTKRPEDAIRAFSLATEQLGDTAELHMIGVGPLLQSLRASAPKGVIFHGSVSQKEKYEILGRADALLCTSQREGWGLVVSEAAAVGTPTIGYDVDGLRDSITAAEGVLVTPTIDALADAVGKWVPEFRKATPPTLRYGGAASWDAVAADVLRHLESVVSGSGLCAPTSREIDLREGSVSVEAGAAQPSTESTSVVSLDLVEAEQSHLLGTGVK